MGRDVERLNRGRVGQQIGEVVQVAALRWHRAGRSPTTTTCSTLGASPRYGSTWPRKVSSTITIRAPVVLRMCEMPGPRAAS